MLETSAPTLFRAAAYGWASLPACWRLAPDAVSLAAVAGKFSRSSHFVLKLKATHHCVLYIIATCARFVKRNFSLSPKSNIRVLVGWKLYNGAARGGQVCRRLFVYAAGYCRAWECVAPLFDDFFRSSTCSSIAPFLLHHIATKNSCESCAQIL